MKVIFMPISVIFGFAAGMAGRKTFEAIWSRFDDQDPPDPKHRQVNWPKLLTALALQGAIFYLAKGLSEHAARSAFARWAGAWPGEEQPEES